MSSAKDDDGEIVRPGDWIGFSYGIPPIGVLAKISERDKALVATVLGNHKPKVAPLSTLRRHVGSWHKATGPGSKAEK